MSARRDYWPPELEQLVGQITYKQGWSVWLGEEFADDDAGGLKLFIVSCTPDSYQPDQMIRVRHEFLVPRASYSRDVWAAWLFDRYRDVETHEAGEFFKLDGLREFAPHHGNGEDPYRVLARRRPRRHPRQSRAGEGGSRPCPSASGLGALQHVRRAPDRSPRAVRPGQRVSDDPAHPKGFGKPQDEPPTTWTNHPLVERIQDAGGGIYYAIVGDSAIEDGHLEIGGNARDVWVWHWHTPTTGAHRWALAGCGLHTVVQVESLTLSPSLACEDGCPSHGYLVDGRWRPC